MSSTSIQPPLITVIGATGTGKSNVSPCATFRVIFCTAD